MKYRLSFGLLENACIPVNKIMSEVIKINNHTVIAPAVLLKHPSHVIGLEMKQVAVSDFGIIRI